MRHCWSVIIQQPERLILHIDMDAFFASVEVIDNPALNHLPVVVGGHSHRSVVAAASYRARTFGIKSAMPMALARRRCAQLVVCPPRFDRYRAVSTIVMNELQQFSDFIEPLSIDEAFLDVSNAPLAQDPVRLGQLIKDRIFQVTGGLTASVGIGPNKLVAKIASDLNKPNGLVTVRPDEVINFLNELPVSRLWGAGPKTCHRLNEIGLYTIKDVRESPDEVRALLGRNGERFIEFAHGVDEREVTPSRPRKSIGIERTLERDLWLDDGCYTWLKQASMTLSQTLNKKNNACTGVRLKIKKTTHQQLTRQLTFGHPTNDPRDLFRAAKHLCDPLMGTTKIRLIGLSVFGLTSVSPQLGLNM
ncbi:MAG: DNA polymerase IV [Bradymonadia bacterium]